MKRKLIVALMITVALLASITVLAAAQGWGGPILQSGMDMGTATPQPMDTMTQPGEQPHIVPLPADYETYTNTVAADSASISHGASLYKANCVQCHGASGLGDGIAGVSLKPPAAAIAYTSQMLTDTYLFYRISEGGVTEPFDSAMPAWKTTLSETDRWDLVNYIRTLSNSAGTQGGLVGGYGMMTGGMMGPGGMMGSAMMTNTVGMGSMGAMGMNCPMMSGATMTNTVGMGAGSMGAMGGMGSMSGMGMNCPMMGGATMTNTVGMGAGSMGAMGSMGMNSPSMSGNGMNGMTMPGGSMQNNMPGMAMPGISTATTAGLAEAEVAPWYTNPWYLLGWVLLALVVLAVLAGTVLLALHLLRRSRAIELSAT